MRINGGQAVIDMFDTTLTESGVTVRGVYNSFSKAVENEKQIYLYNFDGYSTPVGIETKTTTEDVTDEDENTITYDVYAFYVKDTLYTVHYDNKVYKTESFSAYILDFSSLEDITLQDEELEGIYDELEDAMESGMPILAKGVTAVAIFGTSEPQTFYVTPKKYTGYTVLFVQEYPNNTPTTFQAILIDDEDNVSYEAYEVTASVDADDVAFDNTDTGMESDNVQDAITELNSDIVTLSNANNIDTTDEKVVGNYIYMDGATKKIRPIYQKVLRGTTTASGSAFTVPLGVQNLGLILSIGGSITHSTEVMFIGGWLSNQDYDAKICYYNVSSGNFDCYCGSGLAGDKEYNFIVRFTKSSDTPTVIEQ